MTCKNACVGDIFEENLSCIIMTIKTAIYNLKYKHTQKLTVYNVNYPIIDITPSVVYNNHQLRHIIYWRVSITRLGIFLETTKRNARKEPNGNCRYLSANSSQHKTCHLLSKESDRRSLVFYHLFIPWIALNVKTPSKGRLIFMQEKWYLCGLRKTALLTPVCYVMLAEQVVSLLVGVCAVLNGKFDYISIHLLLWTIPYSTQCLVWFLTKRWTLWF